MGKASMCIQMLQILSTGKVYKVSELADLLETNPRNIIEYKRELEEAGYYVISIPGKFGGYRLDQTGVIPSLLFTEDEKRALAEGSGYLDARKDFLFKKDYKRAISKVYSSIKHPEKQTEAIVINRFPLSMQDEELKARYSVIKSCAEECVVVKLKYRTLKNELFTHNVEPYDVFMYNDAWYFVGYDREDNDIRYFKINRIEECEKTAVRFRKRLFYSQNEYIDLFGMKRNGDLVPIELKISGAYAVFAKEKIFGKNQTVALQPDGSVLLSCEMQNEERVLSFVLSMGEYCEVVKPAWLKEKVVDTINALLKKY